MALLNDLKKKAPARARGAAPDISDLAPGHYTGKANVYAQTIDGVELLRMGEMLSLTPGMQPKEDPENGYKDKQRSKRARVAVATVTFTI
jgi:hypothetical protein